jgi:hypothetical protein
VQVRKYGHKLAFEVRELRENWSVCARTMRIAAVYRIYCRWTHNTTSHRTSPAHHIHHAQEEAKVPFAEEAGTSLSQIRERAALIETSMSARTGHDGPSILSHSSAHPMSPSKHTSSRNGRPRRAHEHITASTSERRSGSGNSRGICPRWCPWTTNIWRDMMVQSKLQDEEWEQTQRRRSGRRP